jgi:uncharacterized protein YqiB (DUF1249 family)
MILKIVEQNRITEQLLLLRHSPFALFAILQPSTTIKSYRSAMLRWLKTVNSKRDLES